LVASANSEIQKFVVEGFNWGYILTDVYLPLSVGSNIGASSIDPDGAGGATKISAEATPVKGIYLVWKTLKNLFLWSSLIIELFRLVIEVNDVLANAGRSLFPLK